METTASNDGRSLRFPGAPSHSQLVRDPHRDREQSRTLDGRGLGGVSPKSLRAFDEGFWHGGSSLRLGEITTGFDPAMKFAAARPYATPAAAVCVGSQSLPPVLGSVEIHLELMTAAAR